LISLTTTCSSDIAFDGGDLLFVAL
jgi:hypothetical protein